MTTHGYAVFRRGASARVSVRASSLALALSLCIMGLASAEEAKRSPSPSDQAATAAVETSAVVEGAVAEIFANRFILESAGERLLVEPYDLRMAFTAGRGDTVRVEGRRAGSLITAARVLRGSESVLVASTRAPDAPAGSSSTRPPEQRGILIALQELGLAPIGAPLRKKQHTEILARMPDGRTVYVSFDRSDRLWEIEDAGHDKKSAVPRGLSRQDYERLAREAGFTPTGEFEQKREHVELEATNRRGERLELHIDRAGTIYKQTWLW
jgi:hypothetical protein